MYSENHTISIYGLPETGYIRPSQYWVEIVEYINRHPIRRTRRKHADIVSALRDLARTPDATATIWRRYWIGADPHTVQLRLKPMREFGPYPPTELAK